jgi:hypothetical protein
MVMIAEWLVVVVSLIERRSDYPSALNPYRYRESFVVKGTCWD